MVGLPSHDGLLYQSELLVFEKARFERETKLGWTKFSITTKLCTPISFDNSLLSL